MAGDHLLIIALVHWGAWDEATRDEWTQTWDEAWRDYEREQESGP